jgi:hypothetical protein
MLFILSKNSPTAYVVTRESILLWKAGLLPHIAASLERISTRWALRTAIKQKTAKEVFASHFQRARATRKVVDMDVVNLHVRARLGLD